MRSTNNSPNSYTTLTQKKRKGSIASTSHETQSAEERANISPVTPNNKVDHSSKTNKHTENLNKNVGLKLSTPEESVNNKISATKIVHGDSKSADVTLRVRGSSAVIVEQHNPNVSDCHNDDNWSKVESKSRSSRGRNSQKLMSSNSNASISQMKSSKVKGGRTSASRKRVANRKIVKDVIGTILDAVDVEIMRRRKQAHKARIEERKEREKKKMVSLTKIVDRSSARDAIVGKSSSIYGNQTSNSINFDKSNATPPSLSIVNKNDNRSEKDIESHCIKLQKLVRRHQKNHNADQNTAATLPETLSGVSAMSAMSVSHHSSSSIGYQQQETISNDSSDDQINKSDAHNPPLPTLLSGLRHTNSASSSVASSLEAHGTGEQNNNGKESDVGYHLLNVCAHLSTDMSTFMRRRKCALELRRRERGALLVALQDTLTVSSDKMDLT